MSFIEYKSVFTASQYVTPVAEQVAQGFYNIKWAAESAGGAVDTMGARSFSAFRNLAFSAQMGLFYISMLESGMYRMESASIGVEQAQDRLNDVIKKSGAGSDEARRAMQTLERAQIAYQRTATYTSLMTVSMGIQFVSFASSIDKYLVPAITRATELIGGLTTAYHMLAASMAAHPIGWLLLGLGAIAAVGVGAYAYSQSRVVMPDTLNINSKTDADEVIDEWARRAKRKYAQSGAP